MKRTISAPGASRARRPRRLAGGLAVTAAVLLSLWCADRWLGRRGPDQGEPQSVAAARPRPRLPGASGPFPPVLVCCEDDTQPLISVEPPGTNIVEGTVVEADGSPAGGSIVAADSLPVRSVAADGDGHFRFEGLLARDYQMIAMKEDRLSPPALASAGRPVRLVLAPAAELVVSVVDARSGGAIEQATVRGEAPYQLQAETDGKGRAVLRPLGPGNYRVSVRAPGYATTWKEIAVRPGDRARALAFRLQRGIELGGRVLDPHGEGVAEARVTLFDGRAGVDAGVALDSVWSSADGTFRFLASPSMRVFVTAHHADFAPASSDIVTTPADGAASVLLLVMKDGTALDGEVVDRAGRPVVSAQVRLRLEGGGPFTNRASLTGPDGRFSFTGLTAASATISAATESATSRDYVLALHIGQRQSLRIELDREGTISGSVVTARGVAAAGAIVRAQPLSTATDRSTPVPVLSSADGGFTLRGLAPGRYRLTAAPTFAAGASRTGTIEARTGDVGVRVQLPASASLSALVKSATGEMPKLARVFVDLAPRGEAENGRIQIDGLEPGEHGLYVEAPGAGATKVERFVLAADENVDLGTLVLSGGRTVSGRVLTEDGSPVAGAEVSIGTLVIDGGGVNDDLIGVGQQKQLTAEDGAFRFQGVESTASTLVARHPSRGRSAAQTVPAGTADITRELVLSGKTTLAGRVLRAGQPLSRAVVITYPVGNDAARTLRTVDEQGRFEFDGLTEGKYLLMGGVVGGNRELDVQVMTVKITNGERHQQDISLSAQGVELTVVLPERVGAAGAQVYMLDGAVGAQDGAALQASVSEVSEGSIRMAHLPRGATTVFRNVAPGAHSVCALLLGTSNGGAVGRDLVGAMPQRLPVTCQTIAVGGAAQTLTIGGV